MQQMAPRKTITGPTGMTPRKTVGAPSTTTPRKVIVGSTAAPPRKTLVGNLAAPRPKTLVGNLLAPPRKTTAANLGAGSNGPRPRGELAAPNSAANVSFGQRSLGRSDGNLGRSVGSVPRTPSGPANPVMNWSKPQGTSKVMGGGMGEAAARMGRSARRGARSQFYGE